MAVQWQKVYVFVSSTFNDMHAERDYLVKQVFPHLQEWCEQRKLRLVDIDLRWGVTEADATQNKRVVQVCLERIDACRPFFLCFLGQRRGWTPARDDISAEAYTKYPELAKYAGDASVTELEILHALVNPLHRSRMADADAEKTRPAEHSFFYLRESSYLNEMPVDAPDLRVIYTNEGIVDPESRRKADEELARWRQAEIPRTGRPVRVYTARWNARGSTPEIRLPLQCPSTAERGSAAWRMAMANWSGQWARAGVHVSPDGEIRDPVERGKADAHNEKLAQGRLADFTCEGAPLADRILADLEAAITMRFPEHVASVALNPLQRELDQQAQFLEIAGEGFIERTGDFTLLDQYREDTATRPYILTSPGGLGKTSLLARWIDRTLTKLQPGESLHYRFIGASDGSTTVTSLLRSLLAELKEVAGKIEEEIPGDPDKLRAALPGLLAASGKRGKTLLVLDGLNQLESGFADLTWLPLVLPAGFKLVTSFRRGETQAETYFEQLRAGKQAILAEVMPFDSLDDRRRLVRAYLSQYLKELDESLLETLIRSEGAVNPLYLKVMLAELRVFGAFGDLGLKIRKDFGITPVSAFAALLRRLEEDPAYSPVQPRYLVPRFFGWLAHSRTGLTVEELSRLWMREGPANADSPEMAGEAVHGLLRQVRPYLSRREGRFGFFYESLKLAVLERYVRREGQTGAINESRTPKSWHSSLAFYFSGLPLRLGTENMPNLRKLGEVAYQLAYAGRSDALQRLLCDYLYVQARLEGSGIDDLLADYDLRELSEAGLSVEAQSRLRPLQEALRLSAHILGREPSQLAGQLTSRLLGSKQDGIRELLEAVRLETRSAWLRPLTASREVPGGPLLRTLAGRFGMIYALALTADGRTALTGAGHKVVVWDVESGRELRVLLGHANGVNRIAMTPDGRLAVSGALDGILKVWDVTSGAELRTLEGHRDQIEALALTPDGRLAASGDMKGTLKVWDVAGGKELHSLVGHSWRVTAVALTPDGRLAISVGADKTLRVWNLATGVCLRALTGHQQMINAVALSQDGRLAVSGAMDDTLKVWDTAGGRELRTLAGHTRPIEAVALTADGKLAVSGSWDNTLKVWDIASGRILSTVPAHTSQVTTLALTPDGRLAISAAGSELKVWNMAAVLAAPAADNRARPAEGRHQQQVDDVAFSPDGHLVVSASADNAIRIWDDQSGAALYTLAGHRIGVQVLALTPDGRLAVTGSMDKTLKVWDLAGRRELRTLSGHTGAVKALALSRDGRLVISASDDRTLKLWEIAAGRLLRTFTGHTFSITAVVLTPDSRFAVSASQDKTVRVWELATGKMLYNLAGHKKLVHTVALTLDGRYAISGSQDDTAIVWDLATGRTRFTLAGHSGPVDRIVPTPDGQSIITASWDGTIKIWDLASGKELRTFQGSTVQSSGLVVSMDGQRVASAFWDQSLKIWDVASGDLVASFTADTAHFQCLAASPDGTHFVVGDGKGWLLRFLLENVTPGIAVVTAWRAPRSRMQQLTGQREGPAFGCPACRSWSEVPESALGASLPCPHCDAKLKLNSFVIEGEWRPVAEAWKSQRD